MSTLKPSTIQLFFYLCTAIGATFALYCDASTVYKYKDENGKWRFSDRPPANKSQQTEELTFAASEENPANLKFDYLQKDGNYKAVVINPFHIPIEVKIAFDDGPEFRDVIPSNGQAVFYEGKSAAPKFRYHYVWGDPSAKADGSSYGLPVASLSQHRISQSFKGRFSHSRQPSLYAVDIALPIGTDIAAARDGVVAFVRDDYAFGGANQYFLDKANVIHVVHDDGTYATYAHLLLGSAIVKAGDVVKRGQVLGQSGTSGYSTGPHLHFVIRQNRRFNTESIPFTFDGPSGTFTPKAKQKICPCPPHPQ